MKKFLLSLIALVMSVFSADAAWEKTTSIAVGDVVVLAVDNGTVTKELKTVTTSGTTIGEVVDYSGTPAGVYPLTVVAGTADGSFAFQNEAGEYLAWQSGNSLKISETLDNKASWTVTFTAAGAADIYNVGTPARKLQYNASSPRFACYGNSNQTAPILFKQSAAGAVVKPTINPGSTTVFAPQEVTITAEEGATIYYTLNEGAETEYTAPFTVTETTTVEAYAQVGENKSETAKSVITFGPVYNTLAAANEAATSDHIVSRINFTDALVTYVNGQNAYVQDATGALLVYGNSGLTVGDKVSGYVQGQLYLYNGLPEVANPTVKVEVASSDNEVVPTKVDAAELAANPLKYVSQYVVVEPAKFEEDLEVTTKVNVNFTVGETALVLRNNFVVEFGVEAEKEYAVAGLVTIYNTTTQLYPTKAEDIAEYVEPTLANVDFEADEESNAIGIRTYAKDIKGEEVAQIQPVTGWTIAENGDARAAGVFAYGSESFLGGEGYVAPQASFAAGETKALGLIGVWGAKVQYTQAIELKAGKYLWQVPVYNAGGTTAISSNLIGAAGTYAETKTYPVGQWAVENVEFEITEAQEVTFSLGYNAANSGSAAMPHLFLESAKLFSGEEAIAAAKEAAEAQCTAVNATIALIKAKQDALAHIATLVAGDGLFYYSAEAIEAAQAAVEAAETAEDVATALATLAAAINAPEAGVAYAVANKTAEGNLSINAESVTVEAKAKVYFTAVEGGYVLSNTEGKYIFKTTNNTWTLSATDNISEAYVLNVNVVEGGYTLQGAHGLLGLDNTAAGSTVYANKAVSNNGVWTIEKYEEEVIEPTEEEYTGIKLTFDRTGTSVADVAVKVADQDGNALETVTATLVASSITSFRNAGSDALTRTENSVLAPASGAGYNNQQGDQITYTFRIDNLNADFAYNTAVVDVYAMNGGGTAQNSDGTCIREWTIGVETGAAEDALAAFVEQAGNDICTVPDEDGGLHHKAWEIAADEAKDATAPLFVKVTLTRTAELGCFAGIGALQLTNTAEPEPYVPEFAYDKYIVKNVGSGLYWGAGNDWGTQASLIKNPEFVKFDPREMPEGQYKLESQVNNGGTSYYFNGDYMDNGSPVALTITKLENGNYTIALASDGTLYGYDGTSTVLGKGLTDATDANAQWTIQTLNDAKAALANATVDEPMNATLLLDDPNFGRNNRYSSKWTQTGVGNLSGGNNTNNCAESYHANFTLTQTVEAPNGIYAMTAQGFYRQDGSDNDNLPVFFANDETQTFPVKTGSENSMSTASVSFTNGLYTIEPIFVEVTDGTLTVGAKNEANTNLWCIWDNFQLTYYGAEASIGDVKFGALVAQVNELRAQAQGLKGTEGISKAAEAALNAALATTADVEKTEDGLNGAIATLTAAIDKAQAAINIAPKLAAAKRLIASTNVYTTEAKEAYQATIDAAQAKYDDATLTMSEAQTFANPEAIQDWRSANAYDDFLLSAWSINDVQCADFSTSLYINTWSVEGETDGSEFKVPFFEYWTGDGESLGEATLTGTVTGLQPGGSYDATAWIRVRLKNGATAPATGITLDVNGGDAIDVAAGDQVGAGQFYLKEFSATGNADNTGTLKINIKVAADNNISWLSFKNVNYSIGTAISGLDSDAINNAAIYDLTGRRVSKAVKGGIYIINGKKLVIK